MTTISLRLEDNMKKELDAMCEELGMSLTTFFTIYAKKALRDRKIPFELSVPADPFYSESNQKNLALAAEQIAKGQVVAKSITDLEALANE